MRSQKERLQQRLDYLNLERIPIKGDGNCQVKYICPTLFCVGLAYIELQHLLVSHRVSGPVQHKPAVLGTIHWGL
jgi:hypothetical protein